VPWDRDNKYEHHYFRYLPADDFTDMVLEFDLQDICSMHFQNDSQSSPLPRSPIPEEF
jgi:hypothetical protein